MQALQSTKPACINSLPEHVGQWMAHNRQAFPSQPAAALPGPGGIVALSGKSWSGLDDAEVPVESLPSPEAVMSRHLCGAQAPGD
eukprot:6213014-Pleurochrysis_carterae.AAC.1